MSEQTITNYLFLADGILRINCSATSPESAECRLRQTFDQLEYLGVNQNFKPYTYERPKFSAIHKPENLNIKPAAKHPAKPVLSPEEQVKASLAEAMRAQMGAS